MIRGVSVSHALIGILYLTGCGGGEDGAAAVPSFNGAVFDNDDPAPAATGEQPSPSTGAPGDGPADADGTGPVGLMPQPAPTSPGAVDPQLPPELQFGNGRLVAGECTLVCENGVTDPDAAGVTDGWGYERDRSCLVPESQLELDSQPCDIPELALDPVVIPEGNTPRPEGNASTGFFVSEGRLFDRFGADFVMRGINHPVAWFQDDALEWLDQIATTGSNSVRLVWETTRGSPAILRASIERSVELGMVPTVELHDITGSQNVDDPQRMAQYYVDELLDLLREFEPYLLVNIANEWGAFQTSDDTWVQAYRQAIDVLRDAGINHTLVIDANDYGQRGSTIVTRGAELLDYDPQHNILFSTHMYQSYENPQTILNVLRNAQTSRLPLIVGEFGFQHGNRNGQPIPVPYEVMVDEAARLGVGYLAWSWTGNSDDVGYLDMSENGSAAQLTGWGDDIINGQNGIRETAVPASIFEAP